MWGFGKPQDIKAPGGPRLPPAQARPDAREIRRLREEGNCPLPNRLSATCGSLSASPRSREFVSVNTIRRAENNRQQSQGGGGGGGGGRGRGKGGEGEVY